MVLKILKLFAACLIGVWRFEKNIYWQEQKMLENISYQK
jgi:hypothetical protein